jgi:S1-C subfamily serine protease
MLVLLLLAAGGIALAIWYWPRAPRGNDPKAEPRPIAKRGELSPEERATIELFRDVSPSVVHITSFDEDQTPLATGSGFIWDDQGRIVTNFHVIRNASGAEVVLADHSGWAASIIGAAPDKDLAVLVIGAPKNKLQPIKVGTSHDLQVGQSAFAIGNPFGLDQSLSRGIVSALGREIESVTRRPIKNVIQTDAAVNPGNSGGPLLDSSGRLIGVTTAIYSPSGVNAGVGFAIPVDEVNSVVPQLIRSGKITRPGLGVQPAPDSLAQRFGVDKGALVLEVTPGSGAEKAGLRPTRRDSRTGRIQFGDVILAVNGKAIQSGKDLLTAFDDYKVGDTVTLTVYRKGEEIEVKVTLDAVA